VKKLPTQRNWTIKDSIELYGLDRWGDKYFSINDYGHITVHPKRDGKISLDLMGLIKELEGRNLKMPLLIRFDDILENRLERIHYSFEKAISHYKYESKYQGVFPIKCNHHRHVVEELISCGKRWNFGLEAGSKAELLIALSLIDDPNALLICNGYKDERYIETAILARQLGRKPIVVIEQFKEVERIISASKKLGAAPLIGIRAKLSSQGSGRWSSSIGESAKFGLSVPEIIKTTNQLRKEGLLNELKLLHFHIGSQINDISVLKNALQEASQIYVELKKMGGAMGYLDVGGGLGVDYDGSQTATESSTNYSLQNYANDVVATVQECCKSNDIKVPILVSESGRAITSHFSVLIFNILSKSSVPSSVPDIDEDESIILKNLRETLNQINRINKAKPIDCRKLQESWNDALKFKNDALSAFSLGFLNLSQRANAEELTGACAKALTELIPFCESTSEELKELKGTLAWTYYANLSIFRSAPDTWAINQMFPILPIHRLEEKPTELGRFADLTCDSDGKLARFIDYGKAKSLLELHKILPKEDYFIGLFLGGAYQEVMGNLHNLFGNTNSVHIRISSTGKYIIDHVVKANTKSDVLKAMEHNPKELLERLRMASERAIKSGSLKINDAGKLMDHIETSLRQSTYLDN
tara:strand:+ start:4656 stop:6593 length:1938 start_codon:yes stop_codon:yes gene_type:complete